MNTTSAWIVVAGADPHDKGIHDTTFGHYGATFAKVSFGHEYGHMPEYGAKLAAEYAKKIAAAPDMLADLREAAATLRRYEDLHRAKNTEYSAKKADVNAALAARFEATIAKATGENA